MDHQRISQFLPHGRRVHQSGKGLLIQKDLLRSRLHSGVDDGPLLHLCGLLLHPHTQDRLVQPDTWGQLLYKFLELYSAVPKWAICPYRSGENTTTPGVFS